VRPFDLGTNKGKSHHELGFKSWKYLGNFSCCQKQQKKHARIPIWLPNRFPSNGEKSEKKSKVKKSVQKTQETETESY